ncbi:hypothetical protein MHU86_1168 [Fragilaria crotonensis]|nr:hypothetical protein MHU86_1168 [Fragilaria crotonensis]
METSTLLAASPCALGNRCRMQRDQNGMLPLVTTNQACVCCKKVLHPICGHVHEQTSFLTCSLCYEQFGRTFESPALAAAFIEEIQATTELLLAGKTGNYGTADYTPPSNAADDEMYTGADEVVNQVLTTNHSLARARMVQDVYEAMTPAKCRKENRSLSTRAKNQSEACRLVVWLFGVKNNESADTKVRLKALIDKCLLMAIEIEIKKIVGLPTESRTTTAIRVATKAWLEDEQNPAPFTFAGFLYDDYSNYLRVQLKKDGVPLKGKCYKNKRSSLNNLFKRYKYQASPEFEEKVNDYMDGVVRIVAAAAQSGIGSIVVSGKRELSFEVYEKLMVWFLQERSHEGIFSRAFLSLTWNLMCRGVNTCVCLKHLLWKNDCFGLSFSHVKNDQDGSRNYHPRHIYANPDSYLLCCVTAIFEYLLCYPGLFKDEHSMLFPGPSQEERFSDNLTRVLEKHKDELLDLGYVPGDLGVHSIRKGAGTYASSGTTAAPSSVAVNNRGGWTLGGARDVYMLYERAGDQYVGRILSGMNVLSPKFGASCPDFIYHRDLLEGLSADEEASETERQQDLLERQVSESLMSCFGDLEKFISIRRTLRFGLASVLHHFDEGKRYHGADNADPTNATSAHPLSPVCLSPVYRSRKIGALKARVRVVYPWETDDVSKKCVMRLTGIPPHVVHLAQMRQLQESMATMPPMILEGVEKMLDDRTVSGTMSETRMRALMHSVVDEGQKQLMEEFRRTGGASTHGPVNNTDMASIDDEAFFRHRVWMHTGKFRRVPPLWTFPRCNVHAAYKIWHTQNTVTEQCAMFFLRPVDVDFRTDGRRRLEEFRFLMWRFDVVASELGLLRQRMSELDCSTAINASIEKLGVPLETPAGRCRHLEKLKWPIFLQLMPDKQRPTKEAFKATYQRLRP